MRFLLLAALPCCSIQDDPDKKVADLIRRLESGDLKERDEAGAEMARLVKALGKPFVEALRRAVPVAPKDAQAFLQAQLDRVAKVDAVRERLSIFDKLDMPSVRGRKFVRCNAGVPSSGAPESDFEYATGWLMAESKDSVELLHFSRIVAYARGDEPSPQERALLDRLPAGQPKPGQYVEQDFAREAQRTLELRDEESPSPLRLAVLAYWCLQRDLDDPAMGLMDRAEEAARERSEEGEKERTADQVIAEGVASRLRVTAIEEANEGKPREALLRRWRALASIPDTPWTGEAAAFADLYARMIEEDKAFKDVSPAAPAERGAYWLHKLRDAASRQHSQPGSVSVFPDWRDEEDTTPAPAEELRKLGWAALPLIIEHLDDLRPTRCLGFWRNFEPDSYYLLRIADGCQQIFEAITGVDIYQRTSTSGSLTNDRKQAAARKAAQDWWKEHGAAGEEAFLLKGLESIGRREFSASRLMELDPKKHRARIFGMLADPKAPRRAALLNAVAGHVGREDETPVAALLDGTELADVLAVAQVLRSRCASEAGVAALTARLKSSPPKDNANWTLSGAIEFLSVRPTDEIAALIAELIREGGAQVRCTAMAYGAQCRHPKVAEALVAALDDDAATGGTSYYPIRFCDRAAESLVRMVRPSPTYPQDRDPAKRDAFIAEFRIWWLENREKLDWKK